MKRIRIGNTVNIAWSLSLSDGNPATLNKQDIKLYANLPGRRFLVPEEDFSVSDNVVSWTFKGSEQRYPGPYTLTAVISQLNKYYITVDCCDAFELVPWSCLAGGEDPSSVSTETVEVASSMSALQIMVSDDVMALLSKMPIYPDGTPIAKTSEGVLEFLNSLGHTIGQVVHTTEEDGTEKNYVFWGWTGEGQIVLFEPSKITVRSAGKDAMTFTDKFKYIHYYSQNKQTGAIAVRVGDNSVEIRNPSGKTLANFNPSFVTIYTPDGRKIVLQSSNYSKFLKIGNTEDALSFESSSDKVKINDKTLATEEYVDEGVGKKVPVVTVVPELTSTYSVPANATQQEMIYEISVGETVHNIIAEEGVRWLGDSSPVVSANSTLVVSVINNLAVWGTF